MKKIITNNVWIIALAALGISGFLLYKHFKPTEETKS